jgi:hypothetical protein
MDTECIAVINEYPVADSSPSTYSYTVFRRGATVELQFEGRHSQMTTVLPWLALRKLVAALDEGASKAGYYRVTQKPEDSND